jgi:hypothetical protein
MKFRSATPILTSFSNPLKSNYKQFPLWISDATNFHTYYNNQKHNDYNLVILL